MPDSSSQYHPTPADGRASQDSAAVTGVIYVIAIAGLYYGRDIFVPFALAVLLGFVLAAPVDWLRRLRAPRVAAVGAVVTVSFALLGAVTVLVFSQVVDLAKNLPEYQQNIQQKIRELRASAGEDSLVDRTGAMIQALRDELQPAAPVASRDRDPLSAPVRVQVDPTPQQPLAMIGRVLTPLLGPIGTAGLVIVFVIFILLERHDMRDRFIRLAGGGLHRTTEALNEAARRVGRYLTMQLIVNATYGIPIGIGLYFIGVPNALLWGLLATLLRFVPYLGPFIAAIFPVTLAFAVDPGWSMLFWTVALILGIELISNNVIEPWLYGSSTGLSPVAIILAAIFWTLLWGPVGLILATPLTVCLVTLGRYVPRLDFLEVMLGSAPVLSPAEQVYQRLLADNREEVIEIAEEYVAGSDACSFYDQVGLPAIAMADRDRHQGSSTEDRKRVAAGVEAVIAELGATAELEGSNTAVLCIAGRWELDAAAAGMLTHVLHDVGIPARRVPASAVSPDAINTLDLSGVELICLSYVDPKPETFARYVCRRLKRRKPGIKIVVGMWNLEEGAATPERLAASVEADAVATSVGEVVKWVEQLVTVVASSMVVAPVPHGESQRLEALHASGIIGARAGGHLDGLARKLSSAFDAPIALVSLIDDSCQRWEGAAGLPSELDQSRQAPRETSICAHVVSSEAILVVEDTKRDPRFSGNPFLLQHAIRFYAGAPLRTQSGHVIGSLCVLDKRPRTFSNREMKLLQTLADELMWGVERRHSEEGEPNAAPQARDTWRP